MADAKKNIEKSRKKKIKEEKKRREKARKAEQKRRDQAIKRANKKRKKKLKEDVITPRKDVRKIDTTKRNTRKDRYSGSNDFLGENIVDQSAYDDNKYLDKNDLRRMRRKKNPAKSINTKKSRRWRMIITYSALLAVVVVAGITLSLTVFFKTANFEIEGDTRYSKEQLVSACGIKEGENIFLANKKWAEENIKNTFPYVQKVDVSFGLPDRIVIDVTEGEASYMVKHDKEYCTVSKEGRILDNSNKKVKGLPILKGAKLKSNTPGDYVEYSNKAVGQSLTEIVTSLNNNKLEDITEINVSKSANLTFTYDNRILVKLGLPENINYKIKTAKVIITEKLDPNNQGVIEGTLDVSSCYDTKRSYFNEDSIVDKADKSDDTTTTTTEPTTDANSYVDPNGYSTDTSGGVTDYGTGNSTDYGTDYGTNYGTDYGTGYGTNYGTDYGTGYGTDYGTGYDTGYGDGTLYN